MARAGAVWVDVLPSMVGWNAAVRTQAAVSLEGVGATAGRGFTSSLLRTARAGMGGFAAEIRSQTAAAASAAAASVDEATTKVNAARNRQADAAGRVRVAEQRLADLRAKESASASAIAGAEERLASAQRGQAAAADTLVAAERRLESAETLQSEAAARASGESVAASGRFAGMAGAVSGGADRMTGKLKGLIKGAAGMAGLFGGFELAKFAGESVKSAMDFQKSTNVLVTAAGETQKNLGMIRDGIVKISDETGTDTKQLSEGMYTVEKAGFRGANGLKILSAASKGAREENANLGTVTNAMTSIMNSYGLKADKSVNVINALKTAAGGAKTTMENFAGSLSTVLPIAAANHISFQQVAGAIGTLTSHGTSADEATQELAFSIRSLSAPNAVAVKEMGQFGISSQSVATHLGKKGLQGTIEQLSQAVLSKMGPSGKVLLSTFYQSTSAAKSAAQMYDALTPAQKKLADSMKSGSMSMKDWTKEAKESLAPEQYNQLSQWATLQKKATGFNDAIKQGLPGSQTYSEAMKKMMGGSTGLNTALMLTGSSASGLKARTDAVAKSMGDATGKVEGWESTQNTTAVAMDRAKESFKNAGMQLATNLLPSLSKLATNLANGVTWATKFASDHNWSWVKPVGLTFLGVVTALKLWNVTSSIARSLALGFRAAQEGVTLATERQTIVTRIGMVAQKAATAAQWLWNAAMDANPISLVIIALVALGVAVVVMYKKVGWFRDFVNLCWKDIKAIWNGTIQWIVNTAWPWLENVFNNISDAFKSVGKWISNTWDNIEGYFTSAYNWVSGFFQKNWKLILSILLGPVAAAAYQIYTHWGTIRGYFSSALGWVKGYFKNEWNGLQYIFTHPIQAAEAAIKKILSVTGLGKVFSGALSMVRSIWSGISGIMSTPINAVIGFIDKPFISGINAILSHIPGVSLRIPSIPQIGGGGSAQVGHGGGHVPGYAGGGILPGMSSWRHGDDQLVPMRRGEGVYVSEAMKDPYERARLHAVNAAAMQGKSLSGFRGGFSIGGIIGNVWDKVKGAVGFAKDAADLMLHPSHIVNLVSRMLGGVGNSLPGTIVKGLGSTIGHGLMGALSGLFGGGGGGLPLGAKGSGKPGSGWQWMWNVIHSHFPGAIMTSNYRPGAIVAGSGQQSMHALGRAIDIGGSIPMLKTIARWIAANYGAGPQTQLLYTPAFGNMGIYNGHWYPQPSVTVAEHGNHVHWGYARGGVVGGNLDAPVFDQGGTLAPGLNVVDNRLGRPEKLVRADAHGLSDADVARIAEAVMAGSYQGTFHGAAQHDANAAMAATMSNRATARSGGVLA